jgi:hypothetical protein
MVLGNKEIRVVGKRKNLNSDTNSKPYYQITEITKTDRVQTLSGVQSSKNNSQITGNDLANAFYKDSGSCYNGSNPGTQFNTVKVNTKAQCAFEIANLSLIDNFIKTGGIIRSEIVSANMTGQSDKCFVLVYANTGKANLVCGNTPTGTKETNGVGFNPSDIALFFSNFQNTNGTGYTNGKVQIDYGSSNQTSSVTSLTGDLGINGELGFSKTTGKTMISLQTDVKNYGEKEEIVVRVSVPTGMEMTSKNCGAPRIGSGGGYYDKTFTCSFNKDYFTKNKLVFDIDKLPNNYDINRPLALNIF